MLNSSKKKLLILSDIFGFENAEWIDNYIEKLNRHFAVHKIDSYQIAQITSKNKEEIHKDYLAFGLERATNELLKFKQDNCLILAFIIGGTIAWKALLKGLNATYLLAISSTRLRLEIEHPNLEIDLIYGENDSYKPNEEWFNLMEISPKIIKDKNHELYQDVVVCDAIISKLLKHK